MTEEKKQTNKAISPPSTPSVEGVSDGKGKRLGFGEALRKAKEQVAFGERFATWLALGGDDVLKRGAGIRHGVESARIAEELCKVMAEVYMMSSALQIRISGEMLEADMVKAVFEEITAEHIKAVAEEYMKARGAVRNPKAYLRTVLYNSVFSLSSAQYTAGEREKERYGAFDASEAFELALRRSYEEI